MSLLSKVAGKTAAINDHIQLEISDLEDPSFVWKRMQDGNKCILLARSIYGLWVWADETHTTKKHANPGEYIVIRENGTVLFRDAAQLAAMNLVGWVAPSIRDAIFF